LHSGRGRSLSERPLRLASTNFPLLHSFDFAGRLAL
jgi:hypothetical protein